MKILVNREPLRNRSWGGGNLFVIALCDMLSDRGYNVTHSLSENIDAIFMHDPRYSDLKISINEIVSYRNFKPEVKVIHRVNECDARKSTEGVDSLLSESSRYTDVTVFVSEWMKQYHISKGWNCNNIHVIHNGVDTSHFSERDKIKNGKINIVAHHWSNNRLKGFDVYEKIDKFVGENSDFTFTYIGRHNNTFKNTNLIDPIHGESLGRELSKYDVYVSASLFDPGPNHILESLACKIPTYVISKGGGAVEFAGESHAYETFEDLVGILLSKKYSNNKYSPQTWEQCISKYIDIISGMVG